VGRKKKYAFSTYEIIDKWAKRWPNVMMWLAKYPSEKVRQQKAQLLWIFCDYERVNPDELLALKDDISSHNAERLIDKFVADEGVDIPDSVKWNSVNAVKGYFAAHYRDLAKRSGAMPLEKVKPYRKPTKEDLLKLWDNCYNPRDRSLVVSIPNSTGIAKDTLTKMRWNHIEEGWENMEIPHISLPPELVKGHGKGKYQDVRQETFLTPEAKEDLLKYKDWMERVKGVTFTRDMHVYLTVEKPIKPIPYNALGKIVSDVAKRAGVEYSLHDARRYVQTALEEARLPANWARKIRGRKVRGEESPYSRPEIQKLRSAFKEALPFLMFRSEPRISEEDRQIENVVNTARTIGVPEDQIQEKLKERGKTWHTAREFSREVYRMRAKGHQRTEQNGGTDCSEYKEISEGDLLSHLQNGWRVTHNLQNGRIIVERH
jgi:hypothetical protein